MSATTESMPITASTHATNDAYYARLSKNQMAPLWERLSKMVPLEPKPRAVPFRWTYEEAREHLIEAGRIITAEEAERRVLILENPSLPGASRVTDTIYAGLQLILPGEIAPAHRHTPSALRFVLEGSGGYTAVNGERVFMEPGDFIITPTWAWHDHGNQGEGPVIWLDGLDLPLVGFLNASFREEFDSLNQQAEHPQGDSSARYGANMLPIDFPAQHTSPIFHYPYQKTREALLTLEGHGEIDPHFGLCLRYVNPTNGDWAIPTIATSMRLLPAGFCTRPYRSVEGVVMTLVEGRARVKIGDTVLELKPRDVVSVPGWVDYVIEADERSFIFAYSDRPAYEKLGLWRQRKG